MGVIEYHWSSQTVGSKCGAAGWIALTGQCLLESHQWKLRIQRSSSGHYFRGWDVSKPLSLPTQSSNVLFIWIYIVFLEFVCQEWVQTIKKKILKINCKALISQL